VSTPALLTASPTRVEAACKRCGYVRAINEARDTPLCSDCRTVERLIRAPRADDGLGRGTWERRGLTVVWKPHSRPSARRCLDCGEPTVDQHRSTARCRSCWKAAVHAAAESRSAEREARRVAKAAARAERNAAKRAASTSHCEDCDAPLTTRHRTVRRCRTCWKAAVHAAAQLRATRPLTLAEPPATSSTAICERDGCLLAYPGELCPACLVDAQTHAITEAA
jgi:hypothetical protein